MFFERGCAALVVVVVAMMADDVQACRYAADLRPLAERIAEVEVAFVGSVVSSGDGGVVFAVERSLKGVPGSTYHTASAGSSCDIRFQPGQRWLFAGAVMNAPSVLLQDEYGRPVYRDHPNPSPDVPTLLTQADLPLFLTPVAAALTRHGPTGSAEFVSEAPIASTWRGGQVRGAIHDRFEPFDGVKSYKAGSASGSGSATFDVMADSRWEADPAVLSLSWDRGEPLLAIHSDRFGFLVVRPVPVTSGR